MNQKRRRAISRRLGPIGMSLVASALTAAGFAAFSIADSGSGGSGNTGGGGTTAQAVPAPPPGAAGSVMFGPRLSAADRQKMEEFHQCMQDNGAPDPPGHIDPSSGPPTPPSAAEQQKIQKAFEACKDKLPQDLQNAGPPRFEQCGPPPGAAQQSPGGNQKQGN